MIYRLMRSWRVAQYICAEPNLVNKCGIYLALGYRQVRWRSSYHIRYSNFIGHYMILHSTLGLDWTIPSKISMTLKIFNSTLGPAQVLDIHDPVNLIIHQSSPSEPHCTNSMHRRGHKSSRWEGTILGMISANSIHGCPRRYLRISEK
jgi:hypothetical protein